MIRNILWSVIAFYFTACANDSDTPIVGMLEWERIELTAQVTEPIIEIAVREGDRVQAGQILVKLDPARQMERLKQAEAARDQAAARLQELQNGSRPEHIREAEARYHGAELVFQSRQREHERLAAILERNLVSRDSVDKAKATLDAARTERDAALAVLQERRADTRDEAVEQARQALQQTESEVRIAAIELDRLTLRAPIDGRIDSLPFPIGSRPPAGVVLGVLLIGATPYARAYIPEHLRAITIPGIPARIRIDGVSADFDGVVRSVQAQAVFTPFFTLTEGDRGRLRYIAKIDLKGDVEKLPPGLPLQVFFTESP
ncbi:MAG: HlyD family secretion protein, partial [Methylococcales bacterium]